ncbi:carbohydrate kinase family protein [Methyloterricola oryzae]|uniref:carbohydrate kinase family protein n=1 Tax=Methyloterricola oryzae TaxID=1495050 RepID=UPI0005EB3777|nr:carbohydrate kinase family protein [Methyloterricola oryzae]
MIRRFLCLGSLNVDITFPVERMPAEHEKLRCPEAYLSFGGGAANTAHWLAWFGHRVDMLGCVGADPFGDLAIQALADAGVGTEWVQRAPEILSGMAAIFVNPRSKRMVSSGGANLRFDPRAVPMNVFAPGLHLHVATSLLDRVLPLARLAKSRGATVSADLDDAPSAELSACLDWLFMNHSSLKRWTGSDDPEATRGLLAAGTHLAVTCGAEGAWVLGADGAEFHPAFPVEVIDRTGGGDAFAAGFLHGLAGGFPVTECLRDGLWLASRVIALPGSRPDLGASGDAAQAPA